ncbi:hypothetical protein [Glycomyces sp. NPDC021274]|uniref:hypothetical protein n=1 Tax=Glycomyces sp. NPDC021274 TaxID=3155120 RepID=UPI0033D46C28
MGVGRLSLHRVRAKYARALAQIPLPVRSLTEIDPAALRTISRVEFADRTVQFGLLEGTPRLWIIAPDHLPPVMGYVTGLHTGKPEVHITATDHIDWARQPGRTHRLLAAALTAWRGAQRECEG